MKTLILSIIIALCTGLTAFAQGTDQQLDRLSAHLSLIEEDARLGRNLAGGILIGSGLLVGVGGVAITESIPDLSSDERLLYDAIFAGSGALITVSGILVLTLPSDFEILPAKFSRLPQDTPENKRKKINIGEVYLEKLAHKAKHQRYISGGILVASGLAELAFYFFVPPEGNANYQYLHDTFLYQGIIDCGMGIIRFLIKSSPENEYAAYRQWKRNQNITEKEDSMEIQLAILPTYKGVSAALRISY